MEELSNDLLRNVGNLVIGVSYLAIITSLVYLLWRIKEVPFRRAYVVFAIFLSIRCFSHINYVWHVLPPDGQAEEIVSILTALLAAASAIALAALIPRALALAKGVRAEREHSYKLETTCEELGVLCDRMQAELHRQLSEIVESTAALTKTPGVSKTEVKEIDRIRARAQTLCERVDDLLRSIKDREQAVITFSS